MPNPRWTHDRKLAKEQLGVVGVDEAGRGCLAGPVVAGAVIIPGAFFSRAKNRKLTEEINDSKQFDEPKREILFQRVMDLAEEGELYGATGEASVEEIEEHNIVGATCLAMKRAMDDSSKNSKGVWKPAKKESLELFEKQQDDSKSWTVLVRVIGSCVHYIRNFQSLGLLRIRAMEPRFTCKPCVNRAQPSITAHASFVTCCRMQIWARRAGNKAN
ncbi:MAG: hypothetical protein EBU27_06955 [Opitutae bacterium]|nr:hypothetical protein [Opitutae bacterium]